MAMSKIIKQINRNKNYYHSCQIGQSLPALNPFQQLDLHPTSSQSFWLLEGVAA